MNQHKTRYTKTAIILHWVIGLLILGMFAFGYYMSDVPKDLPKVETLNLFDLGVYNLQLSEPVTPRAFYFNLHKSIGVTLLALIFIRLIWRITHTAPDFPATMQAWEKKLADAVHKVLYLLMLAVPLSGLLMAIFSKYGLLWFGIPFIGGLDKPGLREFFQESHEAIGFVLLTLIVLHVLAAIKHKLVDKDEVMQRMSLRG
jgi:cytochrome b561